MKTEDIKNKTMALLSNGVVESSFFNYINPAYKGVIRDCDPLALVRRIDSGVMPFKTLDETYCIVQPERITEDTEDFILDDELEDALVFLFCVFFNPEKFTHLYYKEIANYREKIHKAFNESNQKKFKSVWL